MRKMIVFLSLVACSIMFAKDYTLQECIKIGLENNFDIKKAQYEIEGAELGVIGARNEFFKISGSGSAGIGTNNEKSYISLTDSATIRTKYNDSMSSSLGASYEVSGVLSLGLIDDYKSAKLSLKGTKLSLTDSQEQIRYAVTDAFFNAFIAKENLKVSEEKIELSKLNYEEAKLKYELGSLTRSDLLQAEVNLSEANLEIISAKNNLNIKNQDLIDLLNIDESYRTLNLIYKAQEEKLDSYDLDLLVKDALENRIDMKKQALNLEIANLDLSSKFSTYYPSISVTNQGSVSRYIDLKDSEIELGSQVSSFKKKYDYSNSQSLSLEAALSWNLTFSELNVIDQSRLALKKKELETQEKKKAVISEVKNVYFDLMEKKENLDKIGKHIELAKENLDLKNEMFKLGSATVTEQVEAKNDYIAAKYKKINAMFTYKIAVAKLYKTIGKKL